QRRRASLAGGLAPPSRKGSTRRSAGIAKTRAGGGRRCGCGIFRSSRRRARRRCTDVPLAHSEVNRGYLDHIREWSGERGAGGWTALKHRLLYGRLTRLVFLPFVPLVGVAVLLRVRLALAFRGRVEVDEIHRDAVALSDQFVDQYPL